MILIIIPVLLVLFFISVNFAGRALGQIQENLHVIFIVANLLILCVGVIRILDALNLDTNPLRFYKWSLILILAQIVLALIIAGIAKLWVARMKKEEID